MEGRLLCRDWFYYNFALFVLVCLQHLWFYTTGIEGSEKKILQWLWCCPGLSVLTGLWHWVGSVSRQVILLPGAMVLYFGEGGREENDYIHLLSLRSSGTIACLICGGRRKRFADLVDTSSFFPWDPQTPEDKLMTRKSN